MTAHHFFVAPGSINGGRVEITGSEAHHAGRVLRLRRGETITVADGTGRVCEAVVEEVGDGVLARVKDTTVLASPRPEITLFQALTKGDRFDLVVEKAAEVGVRRIVPFRAARSVVRWEASKEARAVDRWRAIALSAAKQSRSSRVPIVDSPAGGPDAALGETTVLVLHEGAPGRLRQSLPAKPPEEISLVVGPEGGLSPEELEPFGDERLVSLGPRVLRTETAGLVAAAIIAYAYGNLG